MRAENQTFIIEISEEAYKQNTVYRPWRDIKNRPSVIDAESTADHHTPVTAQWSFVQEQPSHG